MTASAYVCFVLYYRQLARIYTIGRNPSQYYSTDPVDLSFPLHKEGKSRVIIKKSAKFSIFIFLSVLTAIVSGCFSSPPPPASVLHADTYTTLTSSEKRMLPETDKIFTIEDAVRIGLANNPSYEIVSLSLATAYNTFYQSLFNYLPTVGLSTGGYSIGQNQFLPNGASSWTTSGFDSSPSLTAQGSFTIFSGLKKEMALLASYENIRETAQALKYARLILINQIIEQYYAIVLSKEEAIIHTQDLSFQKEMLENARYTYKNNLVTYDFILNFEQAVKVQQAGVVGQQMLAKTQEYGLAALLGLTTAEFPENTKFMAMNELVKNLERDFASLGVEYYLDIAIDQRPDLKESRSALKANKFNLYSAWGAFSPTISANASYRLNTSDWGYSGQGFAYGLSAEWTVLSPGLSRIFNVRSAQINVAQSKLDVLQKWIEVVRGVRGAYTYLQSELIREKLYREAVVLTERQRDMVKEKYENQLEPITRLNEVQTALIHAKFEQARALIRVHTARTNLYTACGIQRY